MESKGLGLVEPFLLCPTFCLDFVTRVLYPAGMLQLQKDLELAEHPPTRATVLSGASELDSMNAG